MSGVRAARIRSQRANLFAVVRLTGVAAAISLMSAPAANARSPAPVTTIARQAATASSAASASTRCRSSSASRALSASGRFRVTSATPSTSPSRPRAGSWTRTRSPVAWSVTRRDDGRAPMPSTAWRQYRRRLIHSGRAPVHALACRAGPALAEARPAVRAEGDVARGRGTAAGRACADHGGRTGRDQALAERVVVGQLPRPERPQSLADLARPGVDRQPLAGMPDGGRPGEVLPDLDLHLRRADRLGQLAEELCRQVVDRGVQLGARHDPVDEAPVERLRG